MSSQMDTRIQSGLVTPLGSGITSTFGGMTSTYGGMMTSLQSGFMSSLGALKSGWNSGVRTGAASNADLDLRKIGQARNAIMDIKLNQVWLYDNYDFCSRFFFF